MLKTGCYSPKVHIYMLVVRHILQQYDYDYDYDGKDTACIPDQHIIVQNLDKTKSRVKNLK